MFRAIFHTDHRRWWLPVVLAGLVLLADQLSKNWILANLGPTPLMKTLPVMGEWVQIVYWRNTGVAFGLFQNNSDIFTVVALLITSGAIFAYVRHLPNRHVLVQISIGLIIGGAIGNVIDRIRLGYVVDFIQLWLWPIFNLADSAITIGATLLGIYLLFAPDEHLEAAAPRDEALLSDLLQHDMEPKQPNPPT